MYNTKHMQQVFLYWGSKPHMNNNGKTTFVTDSVQFHKVANRQ